MKRGLCFLCVLSVGSWSGAAPKGLPFVDFRFANDNVQTQIGIQDGRRNPVVLGDGTLVVGLYPLRVELVSINGQSPHLDSDWKQDLVGGYLPMVQTRARYDGAQVQQTVFTTQSVSGPCDILQVEVLNPQSVRQEAQFAIHFGSGAARLVQGGLLLETPAYHAYLSREWSIGVSRIQAQKRDPDLGYVGLHSVLRHWTQAPDGSDPAFYHAAVGWYGNPIHYRFPANPDQRYTVVLGLCEGHWDKPGYRLLDLQVEGDRPVTLDPVEISGKNKPLAVQFLGVDQNRDGWIDIVCSPDADSLDQEAVLNAIWVFEGQPQPEELGANLITGEGGGRALYYTACGELKGRRAGGGDGIVHLSLPPAGRGSFTLFLPWDDRGESDAVQTDPRKLFRETRAGWRSFLDEGVDISVPDRVVVDFYRASLIQLFLLRDCATGNSVPPMEPTISGCAPVSDRAYISAALSLSGYGWAARECLEALIQQQKADGEWACPPGRWDGAGQAIWAIRLEGLLSGSDQYLRSVYPAVSRACEWIDQARANETENMLRRTDPRYGLLPSGPESSQHKYGDNFWSLYGLRLAADIAERIGETADARHWQIRYRRYRGDLSRSIKKTFSPDRGYLPASPERMEDTGALDNLSAIYPSGEFPHFSEIQSTFHWIEKRFQNGLPVGLGALPDTVYLPAISNMGGAFLTLGQWDKVPAILYAFLNHAYRTRTWAEEVSLDTHKGLGKMPDARVAAGYVILLRQMILWEKENEIHLGAGTDRSWLNPGCTVSIADAPSRFGLVTFYLQRLSRDTLLGAFTLPQQKEGIEAHIHLRLPTDSKVEEAILNGQRVPVRNEEIVFFSSGGIYDLHADIGAP